jgi:23S rRNA pseudouridine2457 synthase
MLFAFHKPFGVLSRFTQDGSERPTLARFGFPPRVYPVGRLDADSEGLLLLSDEARVVRELLDPLRGHPRTYWVQVERIPDASALAALEEGVVIASRKTEPCEVRRIEPPGLAPRDPPVRLRKTVSDAWLELVLREGRNRQVRRMTAAVGHPTLRLVRVAIGRLPLGDLAPGAFRPLGAADRARVFAGSHRPRRGGVRSSSL